MRQVPSYMYIGKNITRLLPLALLLVLYTRTIYNCRCRDIFQYSFVGASLSEPHTSVHDFIAMCVCMFAWTDHLP